MKRRTLLGILGAPLLGILPRPPWPPPLPALGESIIWLQGPWVFRISNTPTFEFGFTGFKEGEDDTIVGQVCMRTLGRPLVVRRLDGVLR